MVLHVMVAISRERQRARIMRVLQRDRDVVTTTAKRLEELWARLTRTDIDLVMIDEEMLPPDIPTFVRSIRDLPERAEVIVVSDDERPEAKARFLAAGCMATLSGNLRPQVLSEVVPALLARRRQDVIIRIQADRPEEHYSLEDFVSSSPAMVQFLDTVRKFVRADSSLLLLGETGVGKERLARAIHRSGPRSGGPFMAVNCGALPEGLLESELFGHEEGAFTGATRARKGYFELAHRGTLFLDEIGEMPPALQVKILRALDGRRIQRVGAETSIEVDTRLMAATNKNLESEMKSGRFRPDLFYRLAVVTLRIPPLRDRREDIPVLAESYLTHFSTQTVRRIRGFSTEAAEFLMRHDWPGNVRELINAIERATLLCDGPTIEVAHLPQRITRAVRGSANGGGADRADENTNSIVLDNGFAAGRRAAVESFERAYLTELLRESEGRIGVAAERADLSERSLYAYLKRHGIRKEQFRARRRTAPRDVDRRTDHD